MSIQNRRGSNSGPSARSSHGSSPTCGGVLAGVASSRGPVGGSLSTWIPLWATRDGSQLTSLAVESTAAPWLVPGTSGSVLSCNPYCSTCASTQSTYKSSTSSFTHQTIRVWLVRLWFIHSLKFLGIRSDSIRCKIRQRFRLDRCVRVHPNTFTPILTHTPHTRKPMLHYISSQLKPHIVSAPDLGNSHCYQSYRSILLLMSPSFPQLIFSSSVLTPFASQLNPPTAKITTRSHLLRDLRPSLYWSLLILGPDQRPASILPQHLSASARTSLSPYRYAETAVPSTLGSLSVSVSAPLLVVVSFYFLQWASSSSGCWTPLALPSLDQTCRYPAWIPAPTSGLRPAS